MLSTTQSKLLNEVAERYSQAISADALAYLEGRGISEEVAGKYRLGIIGIENWSAKSRFPKYGNFKKAFAGAAEIPFSILLSHDPSHWRAEILEQYPTVALTLSGHTHGMRFGFEIPGLQWSPVQYVYNEWAGLYKHAKQALYVNRGFGFIGYPGRVGILPEITVIELFSKD